MYKTQLESLIRNKQVPSSIFLFGNCTYFLDSCTKQIKNSLTNNEVISFYFKEYNFEQIKNCLSESSLFSSAYTVILKVDSNIPKKEIEDLILATNKSRVNQFIFVYYGDDKHTKSIQNIFTKASNSDFVRLFEPNRNELYAIAKNIAKNLKVNIGDYALKRLMSLHNDNLSFIEIELEKLSIFDNEITLKTIENVVYGLETSDVDSIVVNLLNKIDFIDDLIVLMEKTTIDEVKFINSISNYITMIFMFHSYIKINGSLNVIKILGHPLPPKLVEQRSAIAFKMDINTIDKLLCELMHAEYKLKLVPNTNKSAIVISTLLRLKEIIE